LFATVINGYVVNKVLIFLAFWSAYKSASQSGETGAQAVNKNHGDTFKHPSTQSRTLQLGHHHCVHVFLNRSWELGYTTHFFLFTSCIFFGKCISVILVNCLCSCLTTLTCWFICAHPTTSLSRNLFVMQGNSWNCTMKYTKWTRCCTGKKWFFLQF
jgi:hypothetical protein